MSVKWPAKFMLEIYASLWGSNCNSRTGNQVAPLERFNKPTKELGWSVPPCLIRNMIDNSVKHVFFHLTKNSSNIFLKAYFDISNVEYKRNCLKKLQTSQLKQFIAFSEHSITRMILLFGAAKF